MYNTDTTGKSGNISLRIDPIEMMFAATLVLPEKPIKTLADTDLYILFKQVRDAGVSDKLAALAFKRFVRTWGAGMKMQSALRRDFLAKSKKDMAAIRKAAKAAKAKKGKGKKVGEKVEPAATKGAKVKKGSSKAAAKKSKGEEADEE